VTLRAFAKNAAATPGGGVGEEVAPAVLVAGDFNTDPDSRRSPACGWSLSPTREDVLRQ